MSLPNTHPNIEILRTIYADLTRIAEYADDAILLHTADRDIPSRATRVVGKEAVLAKELDLIRPTDNTLTMDVHDVIANDHFGVVLGVLRARLNGGARALPFCGLWRFRNGRIIEHWENAYDAAALDHFLTGASPTVDNGKAEEGLRRLFASGRGPLFPPAFLSPRLVKDHRQTLFGRLPSRSDPGGRLKSDSSPRADFFDHREQSGGHCYRHQHADHLHRQHNLY